MTIEAYQSKSDCHWDNIHRANIVGDAAKVVWQSTLEMKVCSNSNCSLSSVKCLLTTLSQLRDVESIHNTSYFIYDGCYHWC
jgi:hypothetical protein